MHLAVNRHSTSYQFGYHSAWILLATVGIVILRIATRKWRNPFAVGAHDHADVMALRRQRSRQILYASIGTMAAAIALTALPFVLPHQAAATPVRPIPAITAPATVGKYRLITGSQAAALKAGTTGAAVNQVVYYYAMTGSNEPAVAVSGGGAITEHTAQAIASFLDAGVAGLANVHTADPGAQGGGMKCGDQDGKSICYWGNFTSTGVIEFLHPLPFSEASGLAREFRAATDDQFRIAAGN